MTTESEQVVVQMEVPTASCRWCGRIRLIALPGLAPPSVGEYFEKVTLHEATCDFRDEGGTLGDA